VTPTAYAHSFGIRLRIEATPDEGRSAWHGHIEHLVERERARDFTSVDEVAAFLAAFLDEQGLDPYDGTEKDVT
jgi:hypothetical protein